mgnify:CR=1 FL=1
MIFGRSKSTNTLLKKSVCLQGAWPLSHSGICPIAIPLQLEKTVQMFEAFYRLVAFILLETGKVLEDGV